MTIPHNQLTRGLSLSVSLSLTHETFSKLSCQANGWPRPDFAHRCLSQCRTQTGLRSNWLPVHIRTAIPAMCDYQRTRCTRAVAVVLHARRQIPLGEEDVSCRAHAQKLSTRQTSGSLEMLSQRGGTSTVRMTPAIGPVVKTSIPGVATAL